MLGNFAGEAAALVTALCWTGSYIWFTVAVRINGPKWLNRWRLTVAAVLLLIVHLIVFRVPLPVGTELTRWGWLTLSGVIGFAVSDALLFRALFHLGPHRTSLVTALIPLFSTLLAWAIFGERLTAIQWLSALSIILGILIVISARHNEAGADRRGKLWIGVGFALGTVMTQSLRYIFSKQALAGGFPPLSANTVQILAATVAVWIVPLMRNTWRGDGEAFRNLRASRSMVAGAIAGPFVGVTLSMIALSRAHVGVASALMALPPVFLLPFSHYVLKERVGWQAIVGTLFAVGGVAGLFLFK